MRSNVKVYLIRNVVFPLALPIIRNVDFLFYCVYFTALLVNTIALCCFIKMQLHEFLAVTHKRRIKNNKEELINYLIENNVINHEMYCSKCNYKLKINRNDLSFHCQKSILWKNKHKKYVKHLCNFKANAKFDTFSKSKLSLETICRLTVYFIMLWLPRHNFYAQSCKFLNIRLLIGLPFAEK